MERPQSARHSVERPQSARRIVHVISFIVLIFEPIASSLQTVSESPGKHDIESLQHELFSAKKQICRSFYLAFPSLTSTDQLQEENKVTHTALLRAEEELRRRQKQLAETFKAQSLQDASAAAMTTSKDLVRVFKLVVRP